MRIERILGRSLRYCSHSAGSRGAAHTAGIVNGLRPGVVCLESRPAMRSLTLPGDLKGIVRGVRSRRHLAFGSEPADRLASGIEVCICSKLWYRARVGIGKFNAWKLISGC